MSDPQEDSKPTDLLTLELDAKPHGGTASHPGGQLEMIDRAMGSKFFTLSCGRRVGKTVGCIFLGMEEQAQTPGVYYLGYVATDHAKAKEMFEAVFRVLGGDPRTNPESLVVDFSRDQGQDRWIQVAPLAHLYADGTSLEVNEGGRWYFWSGQHPHYQAIQGFMFGFHRLIVDEMQQQMPELVTAVIVPMSMDSKGKVMLTGHPKRGLPGNFLFRTFFYRGLSDDPRWEDYDALNFPAEANPTVDPAEITKGRGACLTPEEEREEYDGLFVDDSGGVFPNVIKVCDIAPLPEEALPEWFKKLRLRVPMKGARAWIGEAPVPRRPYGLGVDWGKHKDGTVISVFDLHTNRQVALVHILGEDYENALAWVDEFRKQYNKAYVHGDHNGVGEAMGERLMLKYRSGYKGHKFSSINKELYVRRGQVFFAEKLVRLLKVSSQIDEFLAFSIIENKSDDGMGGKNTALRFGHPPNEHDDFVDAFLVLTESLVASPWREKSKAKEPPPGPGTMAFFLEQDRQSRAARNRYGRVRTSMRRS